jgi:putative FmdB family regulatory protein
MMPRKFNAMRDNTFHVSTGSTGVLGMPTYEYECTKCGHTFEEFQAITDKPRTRCPECRGRVQKLISGGLGVVFRGEGFYVNDSRRTGRSAPPAAEGAGGGSGQGGAAPATADAGKGGEGS